MNSRWPLGYIGEIYCRGRKLVFKILYPQLVIRGKSALPIVQGGMGVGVSASRLAGNVAQCGAV
jgi:hypothetical protein